MTTETQALDPAHTPGPWSYRHEGQNEFGAEVWTLDAEEIGHTEIAETYTRDNARLIAAAPDLLEFAEEVRRTGDTRLASMAIAAIAKATGAQA